MKGPFGGQSGRKIFLKIDIDIPLKAMIRYFGKYVADEGDE
jgi:hypothetical protein